MKMQLKRNLSHPNLEQPEPISTAETPPPLVSRGLVGELSAFDQHASVALSAAHTLPICFHKGLGAGSGVEGVAGEAVAAARR